MIEGNYSVLLNASVDPIDESPLNVSLRQSGMIPEGALSLQFKVGGLFDPNMEIGIDGTTLGLTTLAMEPEYQLLGADVSSWAGSEVDLQIAAIAFNSFTLDSIVFSPQPIP